jgi:predicted HTH transcriptional regulator
MPISYKQLDRATGKWVTKYKDPFEGENRRPMKLVVPEKTTITNKIIGIFKASEKSLTRDDVTNKLSSETSSETIRRHITTLLRAGKLIKVGSVVNNNGYRIDHLKLRTA